MSHGISARIIEDALFEASYVRVNRGRVGFQMIRKVHIDIPGASYKSSAKP